MFPHDKSEHHEAGFVIRFLNRDNQEVLVPPSEPILERALDAGVPIRFGCLYGDCTACVSRLVSGQVTQPQATGLSPEQQAEGLVLLCVASPLSDCTILVDL
jgi:ferredoxin